MMMDLEAETFELIFTLILLGNLFATDFLIYSRSDDSSLDSELSACMMRIKSDRLVQLSSLCDFSNSEQTPKEESVVPPKSKETSNPNITNQLNSKLVAEQVSSVALTREESTASTKIQSLNHEESTVASQGICNPNPTTVSRRGPSYSQLKKQQSARTIASALKNPSALRSKIASQSSQKKSAKPAVVRDTSNLKKSIGTPNVVLENQTIKRQKLDCGKSRQDATKTLGSTRPRKPVFETAKRARKANVKSSAQLEEETMAKMPKFKARLLNKIFESKGEIGVFCSVIINTKPIPFHLHTEERGAENERKQKKRKMEEKRKEKEYSDRRLSACGPSTGGSSNKGLSYKDKVGKADVTDISMPNCDKNDERINQMREQSYDISPYQSSDDEVEEDDVPNKKFIPTWGSRSSVWMKHMDLDTIFPPGSFCSVEEVLVPRSGTKVRR